MTTFYTYNPSTRQLSVAPSVVTMPDGTQIANPTAAQYAAVGAYPLKDTTPPTPPAGMVVVTVDYELDTSVWMWVPQYDFAEGPVPDYATSAEWADRSSYVPAVGKIVVWTDHGYVVPSGSSASVPVPGIKVGDGSTRNVDLPFLGDDEVARIMELIGGKADADHNHDGAYKPVQSAVESPSADGTATEFIATVSQDADGVITATKKAIATVAPSSSAVTGQVADAKATSDAIDVLKDYVDGLFNYKAITASLSISSSSPSLGSGESQTVREKGRTVTSATFHYVFNKVPVEAKFGTANPPTEAVDNPALSGDIAKTGMLVTSATTWRISGKEAEVSGKTQQTATASAAINFYNGVYYGVAAIPGTLDSAFVMGLANKRLQSGRVTSFTVTAGSGEYIWYALPASMGPCAFKVGGFDGGFTLADTFDFTNVLGHVESYRVYRSDNPSLGNTTVNVSAA